MDVKGTAATPATINLFDLRESKLLCKELAIDFHSKTAKMLYLGKRVRPDILTAIAFLTTRTRAPTLDDQGKLDRVLRYLNSTKELGMVLECDKDISVLVYVDASYGVHADGKSHTGAIISQGEELSMCIRENRRLLPSPLQKQSLLDSLIPSARESGPENLFSGRVTPWDLQTCSRTIRAPWPSQRKDGQLPTAPDTSTFVTSS